MSNYRDLYKHLYDVSIDDWGLSLEAYGSLKKMGIESIGDVVDLYINLNLGMISLATPPFFRVMKGEIKQRFIDEDYWRYVENYPGRG